MPVSIELSENPTLAKRIKLIPNLSTFNEDDFNEMLRLSKIIQYQKDEYLIRENQFDTRLFFLISGHVEVSRKDKVIRKLDRIGSVFGEMSVIEGKERSASIKALTKTACLAVDAAFAEGSDRINRQNILGHIFAEALADRLRMTTDELSGVKTELEMVKNENLVLRKLILKIQTLNEKSAELIINVENEIENNEFEKFQLNSNSLG
jgi:CRP-like cAMP-binding protein